MLWYFFFFHSQEWQIVFFQRWFYICTDTYIHTYISPFHWLWLSFLHRYLGLILSLFEFWQGSWRAWPMEYSRIDAICDFWGYIRKETELLPGSPSLALIFRTWPLYCEEALTTWRDQVEEFWAIPQLKVSADSYHQPYQLSDKWVTKL